MNNRLFRRLAFAFVLLCWAGILGLNYGCSSNLPLPPGPEAPSCDVADECVDEVIDEFCTFPPSGTVCLEPGRFTDELERAFQRGVDSVECPDVDVVEPGDDGYCDLSIPVGHRPIECRGRDHE